MDVDVSAFDVASERGVGSAKGDELLIQMRLLFIFPMDVFTV